MSRTSPHSYYWAFVEPNYRDFLERQDVRHGFNASVPASQLADVLWAYFRREDPARLQAWESKKALLIDLGRRQPMFVTIRSVATAYKHLHAWGDQYEINTGGDVDLYSFESGRGDDPVTALSDSGAFVQVNRRDGSMVSLKDALAGVVEGLWPDVLREFSEY